VVLVHGAWADGYSWSRVITGLHQAGIPVIAAPIPLTSLADDVDALNRTIDRTDGPVVVVGHAYAGGVIGATKHPHVQALVYVAALAPDEGETVADVFYRDPSHPDAPELKPDDHGWIWLPVNAFAKAFAQQGTAEEHAVLAAVQRPIAVQSIQQPVSRPGWKDHRS
jgi:pimeloyl-ACP methyl ester carboxylesterase